MSEPPHLPSAPVTPTRRRATLAALSVALLATVLLAVSPRNAADAEVNAGAVEPVALATAEVPVAADATDPGPTSTVAPSAPTTETTIVDETTTSTTEAEPETDATAQAAISETAAAPSPQTTAAAPVSAPSPPTTQAAPPPPPPTSSGDPASIIREIFGGFADDALVIASCESGLNPGATNPVGYYGLFQIGTGHASQFESVTGTSWTSGRYDARANTTYAKWLFDSSGQNWSQWGCRHQL